jgi:hypothetical protein
MHRKHTNPLNYNNPGSGAGLFDATNNATEIFTTPLFDP